MTLVTVPQTNPNDEVTALSVNQGSNAIAAVVNGNIDNANISTVSGTKITAGTLPGSALDTNSNLDTRLSEQINSYIASGIVWTGDAYSSSRLASMTAGVVYISGKRLSITSIIARTFTASRDTYIDVNNSGTVSYTEVTNNAASPALATSSVRLAIIITGATNITNVGSINQGETDKILPVVSSIAYTFTDSLGNIICPRDPNYKILGYRQIMTNFASASTIDVTGISVPFIAFGLKNVKAKFQSSAYTSSSASGSGQAVSIQESATVIAQAVYVNNGAGYQQQVIPERVLAPSAGLHTYKVVIVPGAGTLTVNAGTTSPAYLIIESA